MQGSTRNEYQACRIRGLLVVTAIMDTLRSVQAESLHSSGKSPILVALVATLVALVLAALQIKRQRLPPGPFAWPVVGNFPALGGGLPHHVLRSLASKYGGLMYLRLGSRPTIVVSTVAVSRELFQTCDAVFLDRPRGLVPDVLTDNYKNIVVANGRYWRELRKLCATELFAPKRLATYKASRADEIDSMMKVLVEDAAQGRPVNLRSWLIGLTSNNMTRMLLNKRYFGDGVESKKANEEFEHMVARTIDFAGAFVISDFVPYLAFVTKLQGWQKKLEDQRDFTFDVADRMLEIEKHRLGAKERRLSDESTYVPDFVDLLLRTPLEDGKVLPDRNITLMLTDLIVAGTETSATAVEWAMAELMRRTEMMQQLQDELNTVVGPGRVPQESDIPDLPFLQAVVKESLRLHPPVPLNLPRESTRDFEFRGFKFPKQTRLILNHFAIHRDLTIYENPDEFRPERFREHPYVNPVAAFESYELTPFSAGRRMCPAAELGYMMVCSMLAHLVHSFDWDFPRGESVETMDMSEQFGLAVSLKTPLRLVAKTKPPAFLYH